MSASGPEVLEAIGEGVLVFDREGRLLTHNAAARRMLAERAQTLDDTAISRLCGDALREDGTPLPRAEWPAERARREGRPVEAVTVGVEVVPGLRRWLRVSARPVDAAGPPPHPVVVSFADVTRERAALAERERLERRWRTTFEEAPIGMALVGVDGAVDEVNGALCRLLARDAAALTGSSWRDLVHPDDMTPLTDSLERLGAGRSQVEVAEFRALLPDGSTVWCRASAAAVMSAGKVEYLIAHVADVSESRRTQDELAHMASHDPLTGLLNRRGFEQEVEAHLERIRRYGGAGAVILLDLDHFKRINDTLGHHAGDLVLSATGAALRSRLRRSDVLARLGGDEFGVLLPEGGQAETERVAAALLEAVALEVPVPAPGGGSASAGGALTGEGEATGQDLMVAADLAMYEAKAAGRGRFVLAGALEPAARARSRRAWIERIERALDEDGFVLYAQPVRPLGANGFSQFELLLRMRGPDGRISAPHAFLDAAERFGIVARLDAWVVDQAIDLLRRSGPDGPVLEVNVSACSVAGEELLGRIAAGLADSGVRPGRLIFEVSESAAATNLPSCRRFAEGLAHLGCRFAIDDFGVGFGSLQYLKRLPCDFIKIDGEFVRGCAQSAADETIVESLVSLAHGLGKAAIAEYVVDEATLRVVTRHGVDFAQGFHVGMPEPAEALIAGA